ncbi:Notch-regulated ankyrin repeat-containing protein [Heterocephalus glaber]|uniref:Notch-regulated ankyrin repeat-containing protein n=1 Tax=Heterocephalus glaber TaxID=10181 RepID=G5BFZ5_HETGA|nr:Notch-regulated ankyrin repeat-containing protein [Heterocephalus glaber]
MPHGEDDEDQTRLFRAMGVGTTQHSIFEAPARSELHHSLEAQQQAKAVLRHFCVRIAPANIFSHSQTQRIFQEAVRRGNTRELQSLLQNMTNCEFNVNSVAPEGQTALHQSVIDGNLELVKLLVKFGADIRLANRDGWSALHIAAFGGHQDIVLYLITKAK